MPSRLQIYSRAVRLTHLRVVLLFLLALLSLLIVPSTHARPASARPWPSMYDGMPFMSTYSDFQISDGVGGNAKEEAAAVFIEPFIGIDLATVPFEVYDTLRSVHEEVEDIEIEAFDPAIEASGADSPEGKALVVGKTKNRVLYATAALQAVRIKVAVESALDIDDPWQNIDIEQAEGYYQWVIDADRENEGLPSKGVV